MRIKIEPDKMGTTCSRVINNSDEICQLICDLTGYFLPRNDYIKLTATVNDREYVRDIKDKAAVCELLLDIYNEWRFEDNGYETI